MKLALITLTAIVSSIFAVSVRAEGIKVCPVDFKSDLPGHSIQVSANEDGVTINYDGYLFKTGESFRVLESCTHVRIRDGRTFRVEKDEF